MLKNFIKSLPITLICVSAYAAGTTAANIAKAPVAATASATSTTAAPTPETNPIKFTLGLDATYEIQSEQQTDTKTGAITRDQSITYGFSPAMAFGDGYKLSAYTEYGQDLDNSDPTKPYTSPWLDPSVSLSKKAFELGQYFKLGPSASVGLPVTPGTRDKTNLKYSVSGKLNLSLNTKNMGLDPIGASYSVQYSRYFTDFATDIQGDPVLAQRIRQDVNLSYKIIDPLSIKTLLRVDSRYSSEGIVRNKFRISETIEYSINESLSISASHGNGGDVLKKDNDYATNVKFFDTEASTYSVGMSLSL